MATLKQIARQAGVSIRTVSRALSGASDIKSETCSRIREIAGRLNYRPNPLARGLKLQRGYVVPVIVHQPETLAFSKVCALERELRTAGYTTQLIFNAGGAEGEAEHLCQALSYQPAAVVIFSAVKDDNTGHLLRLHKSGTPYVLIDRRPLPQLDVIGIDRVAGVAGAVAHLLQSGHRKVYYLGPSDNDERTRGFLRGFENADIRPPRGWKLTGYSSDPGGGRQAAMELLRNRPEATATFVYSDMFAYGVLSELQKNGVSVPGRVSVVGFDDRPPSAFVSPPLSTVAHPHEEVGRLAAGVLLGKISGEIKPGDGSRVAVPSFVERQSTRKLD